MQNLTASHRRTPLQDDGKTWRGKKEAHDILLMFRYWANPECNLALRQFCNCNCHVMPRQKINCWSADPAIQMKLQHRTPKRFGGGNLQLLVSLINFLINMLLRDLVICKSCMFHYFSMILVQCSHSPLLIHYEGSEMIIRSPSKKNKNDCSTSLVGKKQAAKQGGSNYSWIGLHCMPWGWVTPSKAESPVT